MKSKKRDQSSSEDTEESDVSQNSVSSSESDTDDTSDAEHRHKRKKKRASRADSSESESDSDDQKRSKKRKHKKKKKKHAKKRRRSESGAESISAEAVSSVSEGEISSRKRRKHKHKHKHSKHARSSSVEEVDDHHAERLRLHSVVKERRAASVEIRPPSRTYYQKEYRHSPPGEYDRDREVQRFYRGSSKEHRVHSEHQHYNREHNNRYASNRQEKYINAEGEYARRPEYDDYRRQQKYDERRPPPEEAYHHRRPRDENYHYKEDPKSNNKYNHTQYEDRGPKRREFDNGRDYRERRGPPEEHFREREYPDKRERYRPEKPSPDRRGEQPRERAERVRRAERASPHARVRGGSRSRSPEERYKTDKNRRPDDREEKERERERTRERFKEERDGRHEEKREERPIKIEPKPRDRKSRFTDKDDNKEYSWGKTDVKKEAGKNQEEKEKPNFGLSGKLTADANTVNGVVVKYTEPDDAKQPKRRWRFYPFKGDKSLPILYIHRQSCFLLGRDKHVVDIPLEHPSVSKQHAALQYRATPFTRADGSQGRRVRPYIIDLDSANGTFVNNKKIESRRYIELLERDVVKFGFSQREYVLLHENSKDDAQDDDQPAPAPAGLTSQQIKIERRVKQEVAADGE